MLRALCEYYDLLRRRPKCDLPPDGYSVVSNIGWDLVLYADGRIADILPHTREVIVGKKVKTVGRDELFPFRNSVPGIAAETIDHREKYLFGMEWDKDAQMLVAGKRAVEAFEKCREVNLAFLEGISDPLVAAYRAFLRSWQPERETQNTFLTALGKAYQGAKFVITLYGAETQPLNSLPSVREKWERSLRALAEEENEIVIGQCAVSGQLGPLARLHDSISGIKGGLATGVSLVCFNNTAFGSYGREQSYNSSISVESMKKYTKALNYLASSPKHRQILDDMTILFWASTAEEEDPYLNVFSFVVSPSKEGLSDEDLKAAFQRLAEGKTSDLSAIDLSTPFYVLGLKPNSSRLAVKIFERNSFGNLMMNVAKHCRDMSFSPEDKQLSLLVIDRALQSPLTNDAVDPALQAKLLLAVIKGTPYPQSMLTTVVRRCKTDHDDKTKKFVAISSTRARIIKGCLRRKNIISEGEYNMLQENSTDTAYNLGRLFAVLEKVQTEALGDLNAAIKDKYFASACATPYLVFPRLLKLAQPHLAKLDDGNRIYKDRLIQEILAKTDGFPKACDTQQQGMFILGYYQQKQKLYEKKEKGDEKQ